MGTSPAQYRLDATRSQNDTLEPLECAGRHTNTLVAAGRIELPTYGL
jgi:hypothetical protein